MHDDFFRVTGPDQPESPLLPPAPPEWEWSGDLWASRRGDWIALYRPLNLAAVYLRRGGVRESLPPDLAARLREEKILLPRGAGTDQADHQALAAAARRGTFRFICLLPTTDCALSCRYCHQRTGRGEARTMTREEIVAGLETCARLCTDTTKPLDLLVYGGEPLLAFPLVEEVLRRARPRTFFRQDEVRFCFTTSGLGMTEYQAEVLARHDVFVILSLDGLPPVNDAVRRAPGEGAFAASERAWNLLTARGCRVGLSVTMGRHNVDDFARQVECLVDRFHPHDIGLNAFLHRRGDQPNPYQLSTEQAFPALIEGWEVTRRYGVYAEQPFRRLRPFVFRNPLLKDCSSPGERLVLAPGGVMGFCDSCYPDRRWFYPREAFPAPDHPDHRLWAGLSSPEMPHCRLCPAMTVCGGACRYDAYKASGRLDGVDPDRCRFEREFLNWMIWRLFDQRDGESRPWFAPGEGDRQALIDNVSLSSRNQPFTAGSYWQGKLP
ncbi:MAG: radical SAM protein [Candidatus Zixiibacteriota bacterium]|nr:MAG: radical SAM protein [candidate division Zixibacteria bacterium]